MKRSQSVVRNRPKTIGTCLGEIAMKITTTVFYVWANRSPTPYKGRGAEGHKKPPGAKIRHLWPFTSLFGVISSHKVWYHWSIYCWSLFWVFTRIGLDKEYSLSKPKNKKPRKKNWKNAHAVDIKAQKTLQFENCFKKAVMNLDCMIFIILSVPQWSTWKFHTMTSVQITAEQTQFVEAVYDYSQAVRQRFSFRSNLRKLLCETNLFESKSI